MPVFKSGRGLAPQWCELEYFDIIKLSAGESYTFPRVGKKEKLIVGQGKCKIEFSGRAVIAEKNANLDLVVPEDTFKISDVVEDTILMRMCGRWCD